ncbi:hypothetical protein ACFOQM_01845 [Paenibacillus sp. GCM10012307]|uniref:WD40 repeat domain-containing protein n=1 Tax=Paenibacillus roseus TaxID=2798579 RepID=A0A934IVH3_9BACL|nr:hypothetical protein [Paenibacillus roseus]MBJ6360062.1 hypothetical protein [Paenibacillus roseus]
MVDRLSKIEYIPAIQAILASDIKGRLHLFDLNLQLIRSSNVSTYTRKITSFVYDDRYVYTRNNKGTIAKWELVSLELISVHDEFAARENEWVREDEEPTISNARGIGIHGGFVYSNNGYGQLLKIDTESFDIAAISKSVDENSLIDFISAENEELHVIADKNGVVYLGRLDTLTFPQKIQIDGGNVHVVRYDRRHDRFIATQDYGLNEDYNVANGIITLDPRTLERQTYNFTRDDVEFIFFNSDYTEIYTGGFDGKLYVFDNEEKDLKLKRILGPFNHQITYATLASDNLIFVLLQSGETIGIDRFGKVSVRLDFDYTCHWSLEPHPGDSAQLYSPSGPGVFVFRVEDKPYNSVSVLAEHHFKYDFGLIFRLKVLQDGSFIALSRRNLAFKADRLGSIQWVVHLEDLPKHLAVNEAGTLALVTLDNGRLLELHTASGSKVREKNFAGPLYVAAYNGKQVLAGTKAGAFHILDGESWNVIDTHEFDGYPKRLRVKENYIELIGAPYGYLLLSKSDYSVIKQFEELLTNTREEGIVAASYAYVSSYGLQIGAYDFESGELIDLVEDLPDYVKGLYVLPSLSGEDLLLASGNGGFLFAYRLSEGRLIKVREFYFKNNTSIRQVRHSENGHSSGEVALGARQADPVSSR